MAILVNMTLPEGVSLEMVDAVDKEADAKTNPPVGLIVHVAYVDDGRVRMVDVWESKDALDRFGQDRMGPAVAKVAAQQGIDPGSPEQTIVELHEVIRGPS
jgi:hypothetical protein